jgi:hypothetical protein
MVDFNPASVMANPVAKQLLSAGMNAFKQGGLQGAASAIQQQIQSNPEMESFVKGLLDNPQGQDELAKAFKEEIDKEQQPDEALTKGDDLYAFIKRAFEIGQQERKKDSQQSAQGQLGSAKGLADLFQKALNAPKNPGATPTPANASKAVNVAEKFAKQLGLTNIIPDFKNAPGTGWGQVAETVGQVAKAGLKTAMSFLKPR